MVSEKAKELYSSLLLCSDKVKERQAFANEFCTELCKCFKLKVVELRVCNVPQDSRIVNGVCVSKVKGKYIPQQRMIVIFNKTAVRKQVVTIKVFVNTVLEQFVFYQSPNTDDFLNRLSDLKKELTN